MNLLCWKQRIDPPPVPKYLCLRDLTGDEKNLGRHQNFETGSLYH